MAGRKIFYYKGVKANAFGIPISILEKFQNTTKTKNRMRDFYNVSFDAYSKKNQGKDLIVMYDVPSARKKERDWLRRQLISFGFEIIQKSVWVGPSPLPDDFLRYLKEIKLRNNFLTFKLSKPYKQKKFEI